MNASVSFGGCVSDWATEKGGKSDIWALKDGKKVAWQKTVVSRMGCVKCKVRISYPGVIAGDNCWASQSTLLKIETQRPQHLGGI